LVLQTLAKGRSPKDEFVRKAKVRPLADIQHRDNYQKHETINSKFIYMEKKSTLFSYNPFLSHNQKILKEKEMCFLPEEIMQEAKDELSPRDAVIANILNFSRSLIIEKSRTIGFFEIVLN
jgi:hypothetical protein